MHTSILAGGRAGRIMPFDYGVDVSSWQCAPKARITGAISCQLTAKLADRSIARRTSELARSNAAAGGLLSYGAFKPVSSDYRTGLSPGTPTPLQPYRRLARPLSPGSDRRSLRRNHRRQISDANSI